MNGYNLPARQLVSHSEHSMVERPDVPRSRFLQSWTRKQTMNAGLVVPFMWDELLPGDHVKLDATAYLRMATPLFPMFSNVKADVFFFVVPNRLVWNEWERFMGEQIDPSQSIDVVHPAIQVTPTQAVPHSLYDYLGVPVAPQVTGTLTVNMLPIRAYWDVWNEWFRDQNLQTAIDYSRNSGVAGPGVIDLLPRNKFHDYFTTSLPWTQKFTNPTVPIAGTAPVTGIGVTGAGTVANQNVTETLTAGAGSAQVYGRWWQNSNVFVEGNPGTAIPWVFADLSAATGVSINQLRQAVQIQRLLERDARGGTRYAELVLAHFGVRTPDYRVQRPEYIGGGSGMIHVTPVAQTAPVAGGTPVGALGGAATGVVRAKASYAATEHAILLGLISLRPEQMYFQGVRRGFLRRTRYDYYFPSLAQLGEQSITRAEIFATGVPANDDVAFGFQERYSEYRQKYSEVAGLMRPGVTNSIAQWNLAQNFTSAPVLGNSFVQVDNVAFDRVLAAGTTARTQNQQFLADILINGDYTRPLPMFGTPVGMGRF